MFAGFRISRIFWAQQCSVVLQKTVGGCHGTISSIDRQAGTKFWRSIRVTSAYPPHKIMVLFFKLQSSSKGRLIGGGANSCCCHHTREVRFCRKSSVNSSQLPNPCFVQRPITDQPATELQKNKNKNEQVSHHAQIVEHDGIKTQNVQSVSPRAHNLPQRKKNAEQEQ